jgi:hypothetical protein
MLCAAAALSIVSRWHMLAYLLSICCSSSAASTLITIWLAVSLPLRVDLELAGCVLSARYKASGSVLPHSYIPQCVVVLAAPSWRQIRPAAGGAALAPHLHKSHIRSKVLEAAGCPILLFGLATSVRRMEWRAKMAAAVLVMVVVACGGI